MTFENSNYFNILEHKLIELDFGKFYLFEKFMIAEINAGIHFDWKNIETLISFLVEHYGENINIGYISNRVHSYSFDPNSWIKFEKDFAFVSAGAVVIYDSISKLNANIEKQLMNKSLKQFLSLDEAINWIINLDEIK